MHGITVAFGFTLIGVAQDYPIHLFSHQRAGLSPWASARALWPTLGTGVASTCIAYLTFLVSGVDGLQAARGVHHRRPRHRGAGDALRAAGPDRSRRRAMPPIRRGWRACGHGSRAGRAWARRRSRRSPRSRSSIAAFAPGPFWQNDLSKLTPVPADALARDAQLRDELGAPDVRYVIALAGARCRSRVARIGTAAAGAAGTAGRRRDRRLRPRRALPAQRRHAARAPGALAGHARSCRPRSTPPSRAARSAATRSPTSSPTSPRAKAAPPLRLRDLAGTPLAASVGGLLLERDGHATALVSLSGLADPGAVAHVAQRHGAQLLDLKQASESLVAAYRNRVLWALALASVLLAATVWIALRTPRRVLRVLAPMALTTLLILAVLRGFGVELNLFHLVALILAAGLGLDYALFFDHAGDDRAEQLRTLHALIVCSLTTLLVFSMLALSSIPVLRAIGGTVALGVACNFVLALLFMRQPAAAARCAWRMPVHTRDEIAALIPHQGEMCLWDEVRRLGRAAHPPARAAPPRRRPSAAQRRPAARGAPVRVRRAGDGRARRPARARGRRRRRAPGLLVALRGVQLHVARIDDLPGALECEAEALVEGDGGQQYAFRITHAGTLLAEGRAAVLLHAGSTGAVA